MANIKQLLADRGISQAELSRRFNIPVRTVEDWCAERRNPPPYVITMLDKLLVKENLKMTYKDFNKIYIGGSDSAALICRSKWGDIDLCGLLKFGEDGDYSAYFVNEKASLGDHYKHQLTYYGYVDITGDDGYGVHIEAYVINIYTAGNFGCIIEAIGGHCFEIRSSSQSSANAQPACEMPDLVKKFNVAPTQIYDQWEGEEAHRNALADGATQADINALGRWLTRYGDYCWDTESYLIDPDSDTHLYPVYLSIGDDDSDDIRYIGWSFSREDWICVEAPAPAWVEDLNSY